MEAAYSAGRVSSEERKFSKDLKKELEIDAREDGEKYWVKKDVDGIQDDWPQLIF